MVDFLHTESSFEQNNWHLNVARSNDVKPTLSAKIASKQYALPMMTCSNNGLQWTETIFS